MRLEVGCIVVALTSSSVSNAPHDVGMLPHAIYET